MNGVVNFIDYSSLYAMNNYDKHILMSSNYPGNINNYINPSGTALDLGMISRAIIFLSEQ